MVRLQYSLKQTVFSVAKNAIFITHFHVLHLTKQCQTPRNTRWDSRVVWCSVRTASRCIGHSSMRARVGGRLRGCVPLLVRRATWRLLFFPSRVCIPACYSAVAVIINGSTPPPPRQQQRSSHQSTISNRIYFVAASILMPRKSTSF